LRTLGLFLLALQVQGTGTPESAATQQDLLELVSRSSPVSKIVLGVLILFSITSWAIILYKLWTLGRAERQSSAFLDVFRRSSKFSEVQAVTGTLGESPLVGVFQAGYAELNTQLRAAGSTGTNPGVATRAGLKSLQALDRALLRAATVEVNKLESRLTFLATTASITPYIGLFGTVWGIMGSFQGIGATGSTNLGVVAPGIAEALIATAAGLFAAIPAVYFYNHLTGRVKLLASDMDDFALEFLNISERNFT
jgi:biopolymer transport protein TolQ